MRNIYLIGMMGSGKTTTGRSLARLLKREFIDLDEMLVKKLGKSIPRIFEEEGEPAFRNAEQEVLKQAAQSSGSVIATGGGVILNPENHVIMKNTGSIIYLNTNLECLWERVKHSKDRPLLKSASAQDKLAEIYNVRRPLYESIADYSFTTDRKKSEAVAEEIYERCFKNKTLC